MAGLMIGLLVGALDNSIMSTAMPKVISSLGGMVYYVWPFTIYMLTSTIAIILSESFQIFMVVSESSCLV
jgi:MFS family permease